MRRWRCSRVSRTVNGTRLYYEVAGSGPPLVLIHGFTLDTRHVGRPVRGVRGALSGRPLRYARLRQDPPSLESAPYTHADDLAALLDHLDIPQAAISASRWAARSRLISRSPTRDDARPDPGRCRHRRPSVVGRVERAVRTGMANGTSGRHRCGEGSWLDVPHLYPRARATGRRRTTRVMVADYSGWHWVNRDPHGTAGSTGDRNDWVRSPRQPSSSSASATCPISMSSRTHRHSGFPAHGRS